MGKGKPQKAADEDTINQDVLDAVDIDPLAYEEEYRAIPRLLATYNERYAIALRKHLRAKANVNRTYAQRLLALRVELEEKGEKTTEANIKAHVEADEEYLSAVYGAIEAEVEKTRLWGVLDSIRSKRDALTSIGAHLRAEMGGAPGLRGERRSARDVDRNFEQDDNFSIDVE